MNVKKYFKSDCVSRIIRNFVTIMKKSKSIIWAVAIISVVCLSLMLVYNFIIADNEKDKSTDIEQVTKKPVSYDDDKTNSSVLSQDSILSNLPLDTIYSFFGKRLIKNDSVIEQIAAIAKKDKMLSYRDSILQICNVKWRINLSPRNDITLYTSVTVDDPRMEQVINYLDKIYEYMVSLTMAVTGNGLLLLTHLIYLNLVVL